MRPQERQDGGTTSLGFACEGREHKRAFQYLSVTCVTEKHEAATKLAEKAHFVMIWVVEKVVGKQHKEIMHRRGRTEAISWTDHLHRINEILPRNIISQNKSEDLLPDVMHRVKGKRRHPKPCRDTQGDFAIESQYELRNVTIA
jgi:hypothetical protein